MFSDLGFVFLVFCFLEVDVESPFALQLLLRFFCPFGYEKNRKEIEFLSFNSCVESEKPEVILTYPAWLH